MANGLLFEATDQPLIVLPKDSTQLKKLWVCVGPGSYVGVRHSIAFAQAVQLTATKQGHTVEVITFSLFDLILSLGRFPWKKGQTIPELLVVSKAWPRGKQLVKTADLSKIRVFHQSFQYQNGTYQPLSDVATSPLLELKTPAPTPVVTTIPRLWRRAHSKRQTMVAFSGKPSSIKKQFDQIQVFSTYSLQPLYLSNAQYEQNQLA